MDSDAEKLLELLDSYAGVLPFSEKASPEAVSYTHLDVYKRQAVEIGEVSLFFYKFYFQ